MEMNNENHQLSRVEELRRLLEDSLKIDEKIFHNNSKFTVSSEVIQKMLRPLKILYRNDRRAIIQISVNFLFSKVILKNLFSIKIFFLN